VVICLQRGADLHMAQLMPLPLAVSCFSKIQIGFTFLVPAQPGSPRKGPLNGCVCVCVSMSMVPKYHSLSQRHKSTASQLDRYAHIYMHTQTDNQEHNASSPIYKMDRAKKDCLKYYQNSELQMCYLLISQT